MNLAMVYSALHDVGAPITAVYKRDEMSDGGIEVDARYIVQISKYENDPIILSLIQESGMISDGGSFNKIDDLLQFIMEN